MKKKKRKEDSNLLQHQWSYQIQEIYLYINCAIQFSFPKVTLIKIQRDIEIKKSQKWRTTKEKEKEKKKKKKMPTFRHKTINDIIVKRNTMFITVSQYFRNKNPKR